MKDPLGMVYYESEWGYVITMYSLIASMYASEDKTWNKQAIISAEIAMGFNIAITPIFWGILAPMIFPKLNWDKIGGFIGFEMTIVHVLPIVVSVTNLYMTKMVFLHRDTKWCFLSGVAYTFFDFLGVRNEGHALYPVVDWYDTVQTLEIFTF